MLRFQTSYNNCLKEAGTSQQLNTNYSGHDKPCELFSRNYITFKNWWNASHLERVVRHSSWWIRGQSLRHNWRTIAVYNQSCQVLSTWCLEQKWYLRVRLCDLWLQTTVYCFFSKVDTRKSLFCTHLIWWQYSELLNLTQTHPNPRLLATRVSWDALQRKMDALGRPNYWGKVLELISLTSSCAKISDFD